MAISTLRFGCMRKVTPKKLTDEELLEKEKRINTMWNQFKAFWGVGESLTKDEEKRIIDIKMKKENPISAPQTQSSTNSVEQSIFVRYLEENRIKNTQTNNPH